MGRHGAQIGQNEVHVRHLGAQMGQLGSQMGQVEAHLDQIGAHMGIQGAHMSQLGDQMGLLGALMGHLKGYQSPKGIKWSAVPLPCSTFSLVFMGAGRAAAPIGDEVP